MSRWPVIDDMSEEERDALVEATLRNLGVKVPPNATREQLQELSDRTVREYRAKHPRADL